MVLINNKRLKIYNSEIKLCIDKKTKEKLRKLAYKNKITLSSYIRSLINFAIEINNVNNLEYKKELSTKDINNIISFLEGVN